MITHKLTLLEPRLVHSCINLSPDSTLILSDRKTDKQTNVGGGGGYKHQQQQLHYINDDVEA